jgi:hypothetical protein
MEVGQGLNWGCSAKEKNESDGDGDDFVMMMTITAAVRKIGNVGVYKILF